MRIEVNGADPLYIAALIFVGHAFSPWWLTLVPVIVAGWFFNPRWDNRTGWRLWR